MRDVFKFSAQPVTILLVDDDEDCRQLIRDAIEQGKLDNPVYEVASGEEALAFLHRQGVYADAPRPGLIYLDIEMPGMDGLSAAAALRAACPDVKIIILTTFGRPGYLRRAMESGASGFIVKDSPADKLARTIRGVLAGQRVIDPDLAAAALAEGASPLTPRERDVLAAAARNDGATLAQIAAAVYLSEGTVRNYLSSCIQKTGARNRAEAIRLAQARGWL